MKCFVAQNAEALQDLRRSYLLASEHNLPTAQNLAQLDKGKHQVWLTCKRDSVFLYVSFLSDAMSV